MSSKKFTLGSWFQDFDEAFKEDWVIVEEVEFSECSYNDLQTCVIHNKETGIFLKLHLNNDSYNNLNLTRVEPIKGKIKETVHYVFEETDD